MSERGISKVNQSMDLCKLIASVFIILIHVSLPDKTGEIANCLARFAVPVFFAISGYFSVGINSDKIKKRAISILKIYVFAVVFFVLWSAIRTNLFSDITVAENFRQILTERKIAQWIIIGYNPFAGHLWYLHAILTCYVILWFYVRFSEKDGVNYNALYIIGVVGMLIHIAFGTNAKASAEEFSCLIYRNGLFFGLPMFAAGMFIKEHGEKIKERFNLNLAKEIGIILFGIILSLIQRDGLGVEELPVGSLIESIGLMLLMSNHPQIVSAKYDRVFKSFGNISLAVYIFHIFFVQLINSLSSKVEFFTKIHSDELLKPIAVIVFSLIAGVLYDLILSIIAKIKKKKRG